MRFLALLAVGWATTAGAGYLSATGPVALRFQPVINAAESVLPPLPADKPVAPVAMPVAPADQPGATTATSTPAEPVITPQMIVEFIRTHKPETSAPRTDVVVPYGFVPPPPPAAKSPSRSTYEVR